MRNLFPTNPRRLDTGRWALSGAISLRGRLASPPGDSVLETDPVLGIRWELVQAIREAIAADRYDLESRLDDLLDDPPAELAALGWS